MSARARKAGHSGRPRRPHVGGMLGAGLVLALMLSAGPVWGSEAPPAPPAPTRALAPLVHSQIRTHPDYVGSVSSTIDLVDNLSLPGEQMLAQQTRPNQALYANTSGDIYIRGSPGLAISVVNPATDRVVATLSVPASADPTLVLTMALDPVSGWLFATNFNGGNVSIIDTSQNTVIGSVRVGGSPSGIAFDNTSGQFFVANSGGNNVTVVNGTDGTITANIAVGTNPQSVVYDYKDHKVFVANVGTGTSNGNVTVINATSYHTAGSIPVGKRPIDLAYAAKHDRLTVANYNSGNLSMINAATNAVAGTFVTSPGDPIALAYDSASDSLFAANQITNNVTIINEATLTVINNPFVAVGPTALAYDAGNNEVYVACPFSDDVTVLSGVTFGVKTTLSTSNEPSAIAADVTTGQVFLANAGTASVAPNVTVLSAGTDSAKASIPLVVGPTGLTYDPAARSIAAEVPQGNATYFLDPRNGSTNASVRADGMPQVSAYDPQTQDLFVVNQGGQSLSVLSPSGALVRTVPLSAQPTGITYDAAQRTVFVCDNTAGSVLPVNDSTGAVGTPIVIHAFDILTAVLYEPTDGYLFVADASGNNVTVLNASSRAVVGAVRVGTFPSALTWDAKNDTVFVANPGSGNDSVLSVVGSPKVVDTYAVPSAEFVAYDPVTDAVYSIGHTTAALGGVNATSYRTLGTAVTLGPIFPTSLAVDPLTGNLWIAEQAGSAIYVVSTRPAMNVTNYTITFNEVGLPNSTPWSVTLGGNTLGSTGTAIVFTEPPGNYTFTIPPAGGESAIPPSGREDVTSANLTESVMFFIPNATVYSASFVQSTLPAGTAWSVTLTNVGLGTSDTMFGNTSTIVFGEPNGSYNYSVGSISGFTVAPNAGNFTISGLNRTFDLVFTAKVVTPPLKVTLTGNATQIVLGTSVVFTANATGGFPPLTYRYGLPAGCASANATSVTCRPTSTGTFSVTVNVTDSHGGRANASTKLTVTPARTIPHTTPSNPGSGTPLWEYVAIGIGLLVILLVVAAVLLSRRGRRPSPPNEPTETPDEPPAGSSGPR